MDSAVVAPILAYTECPTASLPHLDPPTLILSGTPGFKKPSQKPKPNTSQKPRQWPPTRRVPRPINPQQSGWQKASGFGPGEGLVVIFLDLVVLRTNRPKAL